MVVKLIVPVFAIIVFSVTLSYYFLDADLSAWRYSTWRNLLTKPQGELQDNSDDRIYFLETSGRSSLNYRQSCAVESAARQNPNRPVRLYVSSKEVNFTSRSIQLLGEYDNIAIETIDLNEYFNKTPLEQWYHDGVWKSSPYSVAHLSDYLRILSVYKGGGQYLDLDFVVTKPFGDLRNYLVYESTDYLCNGVFHFDNGHPIVERMIQKLANAYNPTVWEAHGPRMVTDIVYSSCNVSREVAYGPKCGSGVHLINSSKFFPFPYIDWEVFFTNNTSDELPDSFSQAYAVHMWNKMSSQEPVFVGSSQYYAVLAAKYCPLSFAAALHAFKR